MIRTKFAAVKAVFLAALLLTLLCGTTTFSQTPLKENKPDEAGKSYMPEMKMDSSVVLDSTVIRKGEIDLAAIDENGDGRVFQDQMDWNVISDVPGKCPLCMMPLKEVSLERAKANLIEHNFSVK